MAPDLTQLPGRSLVDRFMTRYHTDRATRIRVRKMFGVITLVGLLAWFLLPFVWSFKTSIQVRPVAEAYPPVLWGFDPTIAAYEHVIFESDFLSFMRNGIITAAAATAVAMFIGIPHAYALSKYDYKLRNASMYMVLLVRVFPLISLAVPFFVLYTQTGLHDTKLGVTIVLTMLYEPFVVWIMKSYFDGISDSMIEAARVDGCTKAQAFYRVMLPMAGPAIASSIIFAWLEGFNHFTLIIFLTSTPAAKTVPFGILNFVQDNFVPWNIVTAASLLAMLPSFIIIALFQNYLVQGIAGEKV